MLTIPAPLAGVISERVHRFTHLWRIIRTDNETFYLTSHNRPILFGSQTYLPAGAWDTTAARRESGLKEQQKEYRGAVTSDAITTGDLHAGLFNRARVTEYLVDWRYPWAGAFATAIFIILNVEFDGEVWIAEVGGQTTILFQERGTILDRHCRWTEFGNSDCGIDLSSTHPTSGELYTSNSVEVYELLDGNLLDVVGDIEGWADGDGTNGWIEWVTGANAGIRQRVAVHYNATHPTYAGTIVELFEEPPFTVLQDKTDPSGDLFFAVMGCSRTWTRCGYFVNRPNFGGFPYLPGTDKMLENPLVNA